MRIQAREDAGPYRLSELGWLQFETLVDLVFSSSGLALDWSGRADRGRVARVPGGEPAAPESLLPDGAVSVVVVWTREGDAFSEVLRTGADGHLSRLALAAGLERSERFVVVSNLEEEIVQEAFRAAPDHYGELVGVLGARRLGAHLDADPGLRARLPSVLGVRELAPLIGDELAERSSFDLDGAQSLARVFWSTAAYERARQVLERHRFVVLTGPPEMGKTAIAQMLGLSLMTDGWEVHDCSSPESLWRAYEPGRRQVFIADDAFGSTEYRPDAAQRWAQALGRVLTSLGDDHRLIWTSRPAPLKAGLERVRRERGAERFPSPGQVLVDASELDLSEKTLILFRHAKAQRAAPLLRETVRLWGLAIVEHPYFTPERIRRLVTDRAAQVAALAIVASPDELSNVIARQLSIPTEAMRTSFRALDDEHRRLLIALLDVPAGLVDERELAAATRRHEIAGLSRPVGELIDRLTDHFLRLTPMGIGWVHPSWRDLVIDELAGQPDARADFLRAAGVEGVILALSRGGGAGGSRALPLLGEDRDWDALAGRVHQLIAALEDRELTRVLLALTDTLAQTLAPEQRAEAEALAVQLLDGIATHRGNQRRPLDLPLLEAWYGLEACVSEVVAPLALVWTWVETHPGSPGEHGLGRDELNRLDDWLSLVEILARCEPTALKQFGFFDIDQQLIPKLIAALEHPADSDERDRSEALLVRIQRVAPRHWDAADDALAALEGPESDWWIPEDLAAPPSTELVEEAGAGFSRKDVDRVLADLD